MKHFQITTIRYGISDGRAMIDRYCFSGAYGGPRVPRGIDPDLVSLHVIDKLKLTDGADVFQRVLDLIRFYERADVAEYMGKIFKGGEATAADVCRSEYALQAAGDVGAQDLIEPAVEYFEKRITPHRLSTADATLLLDTALTLSPPGKIDSAAKRIGAEVIRLAKTQNETEADMMAHDKVAAIQRNHLPRVKAAAAVKEKLAPMKPEERVEELTRIYLSKSPVSDDYMEVWAGRMLRRDVMTAGPELACATLSRFITPALPKTENDKGDEFVIQRAAQAMLYLGGKLSAAEEKAYAKVRSRTMNFLWDDLSEQLDDDAPTASD